MIKNLYIPNCIAWKYGGPRPIEMQEKLIIHGFRRFHPKVNRSHKDKARQTRSNQKLVSECVRYVVIPRITLEGNY